MSRLLTLVLMIVFCYCGAQEHSTIANDSLQKKNEKDIVDVYRHLFSKKTKRDTTAIKKVAWTAIPAAGYTMQTGFAGVISANIGIRNNNLDVPKTSNINTSVTYSEYKQTIIPLFADVWSNDNRWNFITDFKYIDYPSEIYGLGAPKIGTDKNANQAYGLTFKYIKLHQSVLYAVFDNTYVGGGIYYDQFWNIQATDHLGKKIQHLFDKNIGSTEIAVAPTLKIMFDSRRNPINPTNGWFAQATFRPNFTFLGSSLQWSSIQIDARRYVKFPENSNNTLAFWGMAWLTTGSNIPSYLMLPSTGWDDANNTGRGYIQSRFRGKNMLYYENEYRFRITKNGLLGGVVFGNVQTFAGNISSEYSHLLFGYGAGLRIRMNKKNNTNICIDYGFGEKGSHGLFLNLGEVF